MFRSATLKLTAWYLFLVMAICLGFSAVVYHVGAGDIANGIRNQEHHIISQFPLFHHIQGLKHDIDDSQHTLLIHLVYLNLIVLIIAGIASYLMARLTIKPIEDAHEAQKRFTADVSHELRTPLTALKMESEVALLDPKAPVKELRATLQSNLEEAGKLEGLINSILRLSRLEVDELKSNFQVLSSSEVATAALNTVNNIAKERKIGMTHQFVDEPILGDSDSIRQLLIIILDNAIKYSRSGTAVNFTVRENKNKEVEFIIEDHGIGIKKEALHHIFDRFYREEASRNKNHREGYGLGLSIAKMIADIHDAEIKVTSVVNDGTKVTIVFKKSTSDQH